MHDFDLSLRSIWLPAKLEPQHPAVQRAMSKQRLRARCQSSRTVWAMAVLLVDIPLLFFQCRTMIAQQSQHGFACKI